MFNGQSKMRWKREQKERGKDSAFVAPTGSYYYLAECFLFKRGIQSEKFFCLQEKLWRWSSADLVIVKSLDIFSWARPLNQTPTQLCFGVKRLPYPKHIHNRVSKDIISHLRQRSNMVEVLLCGFKGNVKLLGTRFLILF